MNTVLEFSHNDPSIGLTVRTSLNGPETELTQQFISQFKNKISSMKRHYALFHEPLLPTGFPDIVAVSYNPKLFQDWSYNRSILKKSDFKILHHLHYISGENSIVIQKQLGITADILIQSLERLLDANLIRRSKNKWLPKSIRSTYGVTKIQAIEAKMKDWNGVLRQANMNQWFASESCILVPIKAPSASVMNRAKANGIGVITLPTGEKLKTIQKPVKGSLPSSYASWMFNEWIGKKLFQ